MLLNRQQRNERAEHAIGAALVLLLLKHGWELLYQPGVRYLWRENERINPFLMVYELVSGKVSAQIGALDVGDSG